MMVFGAAWIPSKTNNYSTICTFAAMLPGKFGKVFPRRVFRKHVMDESEVFDAPGLIRSLTQRWIASHARTRF
jgi:hypothetical protein